MSPPAKSNNPSPTKAARGLAHNEMSTLTATPPIHSPSRRDNPFATCWTTAGAIPFHFPAGQTAEQLTQRLANQDWRGTIIGPHGSGKSTLLATLGPAITAAGRTIHAVALRDRQRHLPPAFVDGITSDRSLVIIDGYEQLGWRARLALAIHCRATCAGLLVTSHAATRIPTLVQLAPTRELINKLVALLSAEVSTAITPEQIAASHACHGSNVREVFFDLYDRHEELRRAANHSVAAS